MKQNDRGVLPLLFVAVCAIMSLVNFLLKGVDFEFIFVYNKINFFKAISFSSCFAGYFFVFPYFFKNISENKQELNKIYRIIA